MRQAAYVYYNWFYPRCRVQAQYTFCDKKGDGQKDSNLIQAQVQVRF